MNRSAKDGARSSPHYGGEDILIHPSQQGAYISNKEALVFNKIMPREEIMNQPLMPVLSGETLKGRRFEWIVGSQEMKLPGESGGNFSIGYKVTRKGDNLECFLKAFDFYRAFRSQNFADELNVLTEQFIFERDILEECRNSDRVVTAIDDGEFQPENQVVRIPFLIFELGVGDIRRHLNTIERIFPWKVRAFHHIATGVLQIHRKKIAHQDLKPSNAVVFLEHTKIADFGQASRQGVTGPWDHARFPGDGNYKPPEFSYGMTYGDFVRRRLGADVYMLGALAIFLFTGIHLNAIVKTHLAAEYQPENWKDSYDKVLPYYRDAFYKALADVRAVLPNDKVSEELVHIFTWLCEPDPMNRGYAKMGTIEPPEFSLDRLVTQLDVLVAKADIEARKAGKGTN
jgi:eukaryotic-like serine/threonine-protein kinase